MDGNPLVRIDFSANEVRQRGGRLARLASVLHEIEKLTTDPRLSAVSVGLRLGITARYVHLLLKETGRSFSQHVLAKRLERAAELLRSPAQDTKIAEIAFASGFNDLSYFNRAFWRCYGTTPSDMRKIARRHNRNSSHN